MGSLMGIDPSIKALPNAKVESPRTKMLTNAMLKKFVSFPTKEFNTRLVEFLETAVIHICGWCGAARAPGRCMPSRFKNVDFQAVESAMTFKISLNNEGMLALYLPS